MGKYTLRAKTLMQLEKRMAEMVLNGRPFLVLMPDGHYYSPKYIINPDLLQEGAVIGHIENLPDGPTLVISRIVEPIFESDEHFSLGWPSKLKTRAILHSYHSGERSPINFTLVFGNVQCHFFKRPV